MPWVFARKRQGGPRSGGFLIASDILCYLSAGRTGFPEEIALKNLEHPSISPPEKVTEDGKGGKTWQELPE